MLMVAKGTQGSLKMLKPPGKGLAGSGAALEQ